MGLQLRGNTSVTGTAGAHQEFNFLSTRLPRCPGGLSCLSRIHPKQYFISPFQAHDPVLGTEGKPRIIICRSYLCGSSLAARPVPSLRTTFRRSLNAPQFACLADFLPAVSSAYQTLCPLSPPKENPTSLQDPAGYCSCETECFVSQAAWCEDDVMLVASLPLEQRLAERGAHCLAPSRCQQRAGLANGPGRAVPPFWLVSVT